MLNPNLYVIGIRPSFVFKNFCCQRRPLVGDYFNFGWLRFHQLNFLLDPCFCGMLYFILHLQAISYFVSLNLIGLANKINIHQKRFCQYFVCFYVSVLTSKSNINRIYSIQIQVLPDNFEVWSIWEVWQPPLTVMTVMTDCNVNVMFLRPEKRFYMLHIYKEPGFLLHGFI